MQTLIKTLVLLLLPLHLIAAESSSPSAKAKAKAKAAPVQETLSLPAPAAADEWLLRELKYAAQLSANEAKFIVDLDLEVTGKGETAVPLFEGEVAVLTKKLPNHLRLVRSDTRYRLLVARPGRYQFKLELVAKITRAEPWNQVSFAGPQAAIASVTAQTTGSGMELQLLSGTAAQDATLEAANGIKGFLGSDRQVALRWQSRTADTARQQMLTVETTTTVNLTPNVVKYATQLRYEILQGTVTKLTIALPAAQAITRLQGAQIRDWQVKPENDHQLLTVEFLKPLTNKYELTVISEQSVEDATARVFPPHPQQVERETGALTVFAEDVLTETESVNGLRQVNAPSGAAAAYQFFGRNAFALNLKLKRIEPVIQSSDRVSARLEETRLLVSHQLNLTVEKAGIYTLELTPQTGFTVADVRGEGVEDWKVSQGKLLLTFGTRVLGARALEVQLEQALKTFPEAIDLAPLRVVGAVKETAQIGALAVAGIQLKSVERVGAREIPITSFAARQGETLAFLADQPDWSLKFSSERQAARITAEIFNLITVGDGLVGGSATIRYGIINQGVQEFRVQVPAEWKNVEFTGANIRRKEQQTNLWTISLQDKAWGGYTLVVTYDAQFDPHKATLALGGAHALGVERESGSVAITSAANVQLAVKTAADPLRRVDETELTATDRALITRPVLLAFQYEGDKYDLAVEVARFAEVPVLAAVADRTQITTVLTDEGQMLTQASFMVKNNDKQFQRFTLPKGASFWGCYVDNQPVKAERDGEALLVPLKRGANRDEAFAVDIVYAQKMPSFKTAKTQPIALEAPKTDVPNTYNEWELYVPPSHRLSEFGGNMVVQRGTTYDLRDAWQQFLALYRNHGSDVLQMILVLGVIFMAGLIIVTLSRWGWRGGLGVMAGCAVVVVVGVMTLPSFFGKASRERVQSAMLNESASAPAEQVQYYGYASPPAPPVPESGRGHSLALQNDGRTVVGGTAIAGVDYTTVNQPPVDILHSESKLVVGGMLTNANADTRNRLARLNADGSLDAVRSGGLAGTPTVTYAESAELATNGIVNLSAGEKTLNVGVFAATTATLASPATGAGILPWGGSVNAAVAGLRSIHIDIPRLGERLLFTKVLNLQGESLALETVATDARAWLRTQAVAQVSALLLGLAVVVWQWRRAQRSSFLLAIGLALMLVSVGHLMITQRVLHLALAGLLPVLVLTLIVLVLWRIGRRRAAAMPPTMAGNEGSTAAAITTALAFMLLSLNTASAATKPAPLDTNAVAITSATYAVEVKEKTAMVVAVIEMSVERPDQKIPLFGADLAVQEFSCTQKEARLVRDRGALSVLLPKRGPTTVTLKFLVKHTGDITKRQLAFAIPPALISTVKATLDEPDATVEIPAAVSSTVTSSAGQTQLTAVIGAGERVEFNWTPRVKRAAEIAATVFAQNASLITFAGGTVHTRTLLDYQVTQGELRQLRVRLPNGQKLMRVQGEMLRTWKIADENGASVLLVELTKGVSPTYRLTLELEQVLAGTASASELVKLETPHALDVKRESGLVAFKAADDLSLSPETTRELQKVDAAEFARVTTEKAEGLAGAFRFLKPGFELAVRVEALQPQIEAVVRNSLRIGTESLSLISQVDYAIKRAGVFTLRLGLPEGYRVELVTGERIAQWNERKESRTLEVKLTERMTGNYKLTVNLLKVAKELAPSLEVVGVHPLDTRKLNGFVAVSAEDGVQIKTGAFEGLTEIPAAQLPGGGIFEFGNRNRTGFLAFKYLSAEPSAQPAWKLAVGTEKVDPWVRAEVVNWVNVRDTLVSGRTQVRYEIANGPTKEFVLRVPPEFKNVEITGADVRRRDQTNGLWRVELQHKRKGEYMLTVTWELAWNIKDKSFALPGITAQGVDASVERETGTFVLNARAPLQVTEEKASTDLLRIDAAELPTWAGRAEEPPALAYRYLRPGYQLSIAAQRFAEAEVLQALIESAKLTTVVAEDGQMMTEMRLSVRNNGRQFLEILLPNPADKVWSAFVAGEAVRPTVREGKLLVPLERSTATQGAVSVELTYVSAVNFPRGNGKLALASPKLDVPLKNARWDLLLPPDYQYGQFAGSMNREVTVTPLLSNFTLDSYSQVESKNKTARKMEVANNLSNARGYLASGNVKDANEFFNRARQQRSDDDFGTKQLQELDVQLRRKNADNIVAGQNAVTLNYQALNGVAVDQPGQENKPMVWADIQSAEKQWDKLQQAQEVAAAKVPPLRVNLPQRGLRYSFSQVLQTEVGREMTVEMFATDARAINWTGRWVIGVAAFLSLWGVVAKVGRRTEETVMG